MPRRSPAGESFMRFWVRRWLDDQRIRGKGDDGQRVGGLTLEQEAAYLRLCLAQYDQPDGYLPNRKAFLCDAVACASASCGTVIVPVLKVFFKQTKDGSRLFNERVRAEWEKSHSKSLQAKAAAELSWRRRKQRLSSSNADAYADAYADAGCERERERDINTSPLPSPQAPRPNGNHPPQPPSHEGGARAGHQGAVRLAVVLAEGYPTLATERGVRTAIRRRLDVCAFDDVEREIRTWVSEARPWNELPSWILPGRLRARAEKLERRL